MVLEGFSSSKWPLLGRRRHSKSGGFSDSKRKEEFKLFKSKGAVSGRKLVLLHDWWLVKAEPDSNDKRLCIGGFTLKQNEGIRSFSSAPIVKRQDAVTLQTVDSITIMVYGYLNKSRTLENGFSEEVCDHFLIGFPYYWEEFSSSSVGDEQDHSKGFCPSDSYKTRAREAGGSNITSGSTLNAIPTEASSAQGTPVPSMDSAVCWTRIAEKKRRNQSIVDGGPLTRSRARLLNN